ncbi:PQQ-binding-like beta-propeller repeat protein [Asticcacaulis sp. 201]|uniref:outer membrane protein assembly factor BamB family protein n=1 Tax=Asticcacaulis sp. 201 TaxID=3028787 RepID=UPI00291606A3|nr:PQQ-binding-like beta-propeller repeat protein [Asticcacaulis sp. 201]MDV6329520.1 PQQ-binding-like beta-propeller repeat protein [Asticcacaulis sp. 201]
MENALMNLSKVKSKAPSLLVLGVAVALSLSGCSTVSRLNPLKGKNAEDSAVASQGKRISIVAFDQQLQPSKSLKGVGYYLPAPAAVDNWPVAGGPGVVVENAAAASDFRVAWSKGIGARSKGVTEVLAQPVSDGKTIYVMDGEARVSAFDVNSGAQVWSVDLNPRLKRDKTGFGGGLALSDGKLYVTSGYRFIKALDASTGAQLWEKAVDTQLHAAPTVDATHVFASDVDNQIFAFDKSTGEMVWTYQAMAEPARLLKTSAPIVANDVVYAPFSSGELVALSAATGDPVWSQTLAQSTRTNAMSQIRDISGRPVLAGGVVFAASHSGVFQAMDVRTGNPKWKVDVDSINTPWVAGDVVFIISLQGELVCISRESGQVYWIKDLNEGIQKTKKGFFGLGREKKVGKIPLWSGPVLASNRLVIVNSEGEAVAFDPKSGERKETIKLGGAAFITPIVVGDKLFVVTDDAKLVAIR